MADKFVREVEAEIKRVRHIAIGLEEFKDHMCVNETWGEMIARLRARWCRGVSDFLQASIVADILKGADRRLPERRRGG